MAVTQGMIDNVTQLYAALFKRAPDATGLGYWVSQLSAGQTPSQVALAMYNVDAARTYYPLFLTNDQIVTQFYSNTLGRAPDAAGLAYWSGQLNTKGVGQVINDMINAVVAYTDDGTGSATNAAALTSKTLFNNYVSVGENYATVLRSNDIAGATNVFTLVTADPASVTTANNSAATAAAVSSAQTFTLTTSTDTGTKFVGGSGNDIFVGAIGSTLGATDGTTYNPGDNLDGGAGNDSLTISVSGTDAVGGLDIAAITLANIERIAVSNYETSGAGSNGANLTSDETRIDLAQATGVTTLALAGSSATGDTYFTTVKNIVNAEMSNGSGDLVIGYSDAAVVGTADTQNLTVSGITAGQFSAVASTGGIETLAITSSGTAANVLTGITNATSLKTITVAGSAALTLGTLGAAVTKLDASTDTGGVTAIMSSTNNISVTGGSGNDTFTEGTNLGNGSINAGAGTDTLVSTADAVIASAADGAKYTNFETFSIKSAQAASTNRAQDMSLLSGITTLNATAQDTTDGNAANASNVTFTKLAATTNTLNITALSTAEDGAADDLTVGVTASRALDTTADTMTVNLGTATAASGATASAATGSTDVLLNVTLANEETITINSLGGANYIATLSDAAATSVTFTGSKALTIASISGTAATKLDASAMTADFTLSANSGTTAAAITGGSGNDVLVGGTKADTISGGDGNDTITGAAGVDNLSGGNGDDLFIVGATASDFQGNSTAETVDGGAGNDTLRFDGNMSLVATDLTGIKNVENFSFNGGGANSIVVTDAYFTAAGVTNLGLKDTETSAALTVDATALTSANSVSITANSAAGINESLAGGAGNDTFNFNTSGSATALDANDSMNGGAGTDTLAITLNTNALTSVTLTNVSNIEKITVSDGGNALAAAIVEATTNFVTTSTVTTVGVVDASGMTGGSAFTFTGTAETDSAMSITGGLGADSLVGGSKADTISGGDGADTITGGSGVDSLVGGAGNDVFLVPTLADFVGLASVETVSGGAGTDTLRFTDTAATTVNSTDLLGLSGIETIDFNGTGTASITLTDAVYTADGATSLTVKDSDTTAALTVNASALSSANKVSVTANLGGAINDSLAGGAGNDTFSFNTSTSATALTSTDSVNGGAGTDTLAITMVTNALTAVTLTGVSNIEKITVSTTDAVNATITLDDGNFVSVTGAVVDASGITTSGIFTFSGANELESTLSITGGSGADVLTGGAKADTINGGAGADVITGGLGADSLTGGNGNDTFVYTSASVAASSGSNIDTISDFASGSDKIQVTLDYSAQAAGVETNGVFVSTVNDLSAKRGEMFYDSTAGQLSININNDNLITTQDFKITVGTVAAGDVNLVITGTAFGDTLTGGGGADTISGGSGTTTADVITGGDGNDSITLQGAGAVDTVKLTGSAAITTSANSGGTDTIATFEATSDVLQFGSTWLGGISFTTGSLNASGVYSADDIITTTSVLDSDANGAINIIDGNALSTVTTASIVADGFNSDFTSAMTALVVVDNGTDTNIWYVNNNLDGTGSDTVAATEVVLIGTVSGVLSATLTAADFSATSI